MNYIKLFSALSPPILTYLFKSTVYTVAAPMKRKRLKQYKKLHLGCGSNILDGWANIDYSKDRRIIRLDLTKPLPVEKRSIRYIFSEHFIEHISREDLLSLLRECYRVLKPEGVIRITTPSLRKLISVYRTGQLTEFENVGWIPMSPCQLMNGGMRLWGHKFIYDKDELYNILFEVGFQDVKVETFGNSDHEELEHLECRPFHDELIIEATR